MLTLLPMLLACPVAKHFPSDSAPPGHALILVSMDGMRWDYPARAALPTLARFAEEGTHAEGLIPAFPSKTFPNHYTQVTGLYPEHHGIVENTMRDPRTGAVYTIDDPEAVGDASWYAGEPIWVSAERQGQRAATCLWVGSEAPIGGARPSDWVSYSEFLDWDERVDLVLDWLDRPPDTRPSLITLYFSEPDGAGHHYGPDSAQTLQEASEVDAMLARLVEGLELRGALETTDIVVMSDHGMSAVAPERIVFIDDLVDSYRLDIVTWSPMLSFYAEDDEAEALLAGLDADPHLQCARKEELPERLHYADNERIPPYVCIVDDGYSVGTHSWLAASPDYFEGGSHGYDNAAESMRGVFYARGPSFAAGRTVDAFESVDLYNVFAAVLGIEPAPNDGDPARVGALLR